MSLSPECSIVVAANNAAAERGMSMWRNRAEAAAARHVGAGGSSVPDYGMKVEKPITVRMRDGVRISLCVYRPDAEGRFPALFAASPYQYEMDDVPAYSVFLWRETGPVEWYVSQG